MKILHIIIDLKETAGTTVFCNALASSQKKIGHDTDVMTKANYSAEALVNFDVVHMHAIWSPFNVRVMRDCWVRGVPFVVSIHGCLMPRVFQKGRIKKWVFWWFFLKPLLKKANAIHCTSEEEKEICAKLGLPGPYIVAPLGVYLPPAVGARVPSRSQRNVLFLGRLGEEKGLLNLLEAWHQLQQEGVIHSTTNSYNYKLILAGPDWLGYKSKLDAKIETDHIGGVEFPGLVHGETKDKLYREADIFVLPSPMENFSMVVLDALAYGIPAIATRGTPWQELESEHCGWWIDQGVESLKNALREAFSTSTADLNLLGANGRALSERKYRWSKVAEEVILGYNKYISG